ncbi:MAG: PhzF family phenazine biosynthesis protein [Syntrophobacteraceae bacterium]
MKIPIYQVDAFTSEVFSGNPAAVCLLDGWLPDSMLQAIAAENNLSETAFLVRDGDGYALRWFTPLTEVWLCGHATLASACVLFDLKEWPHETVCFQTIRSGKLIVEKKEHLFEMDFPSRPPVGNRPAGELIGALGIRPQKVLYSEEDWLVIVESEESVRDLEPDFNAIARLDCRGVIVTARGEKADFVSRFFAPKVGVAEDPVTGSSHCVLTPYWAGLLQKESLHALQVSKRGGELFCRDRGKRVSIAGKAALYLEGMISV